MAQVTPYLTLFDAQKAIRFYQDVFDATIYGKIEMLSDFEGFETYSDKVAHCALLVFDTLIFINDNLEEDPLDIGDHIQLVVKFDEESHLHEAFVKLKEDGHVFSDLQNVPWGRLGATVRDRFHVTWMMFVA